MIAGKMVEFNLRLLTYNVHKGIGGIDRRYRPKRVIETIAQHQPDIVFLQEVDDGVPRSNHDCQVDLFAAELGMEHAAYQRNVAVKEGHYGNAILSRFPLTQVDHLDLTIRFKKRRQALIANCHIAMEGVFRDLLLVNFHLGLAGFERRIQVNRLLDSDVLQRLEGAEATIVAGDCNDFWGTLAERIMHPAGFQSAGCGLKTFPALFPAMTLDYIYHRGDLQLQQIFTCKSSVAREASDHLPLIADFVLPPLAT